MVLALSIFIFSALLIGLGIFISKQGHALSALAPDKNWSWLKPFSKLFIGLGLLGIPLIIKLVTSLLYLWLIIAILLICVFTFRFVATIK